MQRIAVVVTTISDGMFLYSYINALERTHPTIHITIYVIGDKNTPPECKLNVEKINSEGLPCFYYDVESQNRFLRAFPELAQAIPYCSDNRRNVGYLLALSDNQDVIISVDDDNLPIEDQDFFNDHGMVGRHQTLPTVESQHKWFNICSLLTVVDGQQNKTHAYPRGYPYKLRWDDQSQINSKKETGLVAVNVGLWRGDPDVDAATRMVTRVQASSPEKSQAYFLGRGQRTPINSQNTALISEAIPAYYFIQMGYDLGGMKLDRFGDIFSGYFLLLCSEAVGHRIRIGLPTVYQKRNEHNLFKDLWHELPGMILIEELVQLLASPLTPTSSYQSAYLELADRLLSWAFVNRPFLWQEGIRQYFGEVTKIMRLWVAACSELSPKKTVPELVG